ncbi:MAG: BatD family protein, partial [Flavobacteriales bacterium]
KNTKLSKQREHKKNTTISLSKSKGYVGEQVVATYMLYSRYNNLQSVSKELPKISNAWTEEVDLGELHWEEKMQTINGLPYRGAVLRKQVLFPQRSGKLRIEPFEQTCVIDRSFFNQGRTVEVRSNAVEYTVLDLPSGAPADFSGAVGELQMTVTASRTRLQENESVDLTVRFSGRTNLKLLEAPAIALPNDIETFEPKVTDRITVNGNGMSGSREYQFLLIPRHEGNYELPPVTVSYFDT